MTDKADKANPACGSCGRHMEKAHRIHAGVRYCSTCYGRCFKRLLCRGCGDFKKLPVSNPEAVCQACFAKRPCVRCERAGRPVGLITASGPVCNACRPWFIEAKTCERCSELTHRLSRVSRMFGSLQVCESLPQLLNT